MPSQFLSQIIAEVGPVDGYLHVDPILLDTPTTLATSTFANVSKYQPWTVADTAAMLNRHPVAGWRSLSATVSSRPGVYGRMCTFYGGWSANDAAAPTTVREMRQLKGAVMTTVGGTGDPGMYRVVIPAPFDGTMSDVLKTRYNEGVRAVFYYCFTEIDLATSPPTADRFCIEFDGHYDVYGRY